MEFVGEGARNCKYGIVTWGCAQDQNDGQSSGETTANTETDPCGMTDKKTNNNRATSGQQQRLHRNCKRDAGLLLL
jgi:hypothetical protein